MEMLTLEYAKKYTDSQRLAYEENNVYCYDDSKEIISSKIGDDIINMCRATKNSMDISSIIGSEVIYTLDEVPHTYKVDSSSVMSMVPGLFVVFNNIASTPLLYLINTQEAVEAYNQTVSEGGMTPINGIGLYLLETLSSEHNSKVISVSTSKVKTIEPKFIPNYRPVVELSYSDSDFELMLNTGTTISLDDDTLTKVKEAFERDGVIKLYWVDSRVDNSPKVCLHFHVGGGTVDGSKIIFASSFDTGSSGMSMKYLEVNPTDKTLKWYGK